MKLMHYLNLLITLPPEGIWKRVVKRTWQFKQRVKLLFLNDKKLENSIKATSILKFFEKKIFFSRSNDDFYALPFLKFHKEELISEFRSIFPGAERKIINLSNTICKHNFVLLGSGPYNFGESIDWHLDFKTGHRWKEKAFYRDLTPAPYPGGYDIKIPWELSRCQHFVWLGQAYWLSGDENYAQEFCVQFKHWVVNNPPQMGVNWVCAMDVSIRAANCLWGYAYFRHSKTLKDEFHQLFYQSMQQHGEHIFYNLEYSEILTSNHYLSDIVGLVYLGILLPELRESKKWRDFGLRELETEMFKQVYSDGVDFEASTNYHRLVTELFLSATILAQLNGYIFRPEYLERLEKMIDVLGIIMRPDGTTPVIGDQDNGRLHRLKVWEDPEQEWVNFRPLLAAGLVWLQKPTGFKFLDSDWIEAFWLVGPEAIKQYKEISKNISVTSRSVLLPDGGWGVLGDTERYLMFEAGPVGQNGVGGHAHNDSLSLDVFANGQSWIVDPGTYVYTQDYEARHHFRSTKVHNTVYIPGAEQNQLDSKSAFQTKLASNTKILLWVADESLSLMSAEVYYAGSNIIHRRTVFYLPEAFAWLVADKITPLTFEPQFHLIFQAGIDAKITTSICNGVQLINQHSQKFWVLSRQDNPPLISKGWVSNSYGIKKECLQVDFSCNQIDTNLWFLLPDTPGLDLAQRVNTLQKTWDGLKTDGRYYNLLA
jgi:hypothetical protein